jgi:pimeloyl-ACP methyl ester carboxylesterase
MDILLLPGNSKKHKVWIDKVELEMKPLFEHSATNYYDHWWQGEDDAIIDMEAELAKLESTVDQLKSYIVFAKSAGAALALYAMNEGVISPDVCVFVGMPINWCKENGFAIDEWLLEYDVPTLFIQNKNDPAIHFDDLKDYLFERNVHNHHMVELEGDSHDYDTIPELKRLTEEFIDL